MTDELLSSDPKAGELLSADPNAAAAPPVATPPKAQGGGSTDTALVGALTEHLMSYVPKILMEAATHPGLKSTFGALGNLAGAAGAVGEGIATGHPLAGLAAMGPAAWAGGKGGWRLGVLTQRFAAPMAKLAEELAPYIKDVASRAVAGQGVNDWAQLAEPDRQDIGVMGVGKSLSDADLVSGLVTKRGMAPMNAAKAVSKGNLQKFNELMKPYLKQS